MGSSLTLCFYRKQLARCRGVGFALISLKTFGGRKSQAPKPKDNFNLPRSTKGHKAGLKPEGWPAPTRLPLRLQKAVTGIQAQNGSFAGSRTDWAPGIGDVV